MQECYKIRSNEKPLSIVLPASPELKMTVGDPPDPGRGGATGGGGGGGIGLVEDCPSVRQGGGGGGGGGGGTLDDGVLYDLSDTWKTNTNTMNSDVVISFCHYSFFIHSFIHSFLVVNYSKLTCNWWRRWRRRWDGNF